MLVFPLSDFIHRIGQILIVFNQLGKFAGFIKVRLKLFFWKWPLFPNPVLLTI